MTILILGLALFLGVHSVRIFADGWRTAMLARVGEKKWKIGYTLVSLAGFGLILWGYSLARAHPVFLWLSPPWMRHLVGLLMLAAFILLAASKVPGNAIRAKVHHPMLLSVKVWSLAHLVANGWLHDVMLFGSFLVWSVLCFRSARQRDRIAGVSYPPVSLGATVVTIVAGAAACALFAAYLHGLLFGVRPI